MKTVTGKIIDSTPVTIGKAASILSKFVSSETGVSQAVNAYLRRATAAFDELARLHSKSEGRKHKKDSVSTQSMEVSQSKLVNNNEQRLKKELKEEGNVGEEETERKDKMKKKKKKGDVAEETERSNEIKKENIEVEENRGEVVDEIEIKEEEEKKKKKKRRKSAEVEVNEEEKEGKDGLEDEGQRKKKKRRKQVDDN